VGIGDVVEAKEVTRAPTDPRTSAVVGHRLDFDLANVLCCDNSEEPAAGFFGVEVSGSPRNEVSYLRCEQGKVQCSTPRGVGSACKVSHPSGRYCQVEVGPGKLAG